MRILFALALLASSCTSTLPDDHTQPEDDTPRRGGRIVLGSTRDIATLQPLLVNELVSQNVVDRIYERLLRTDPDTGELAPGLAERWDVSPDGLTIGYVLRSGLVWSDGQPLTAEDAKYTLEAHARSKRASRGPIVDVIGYAEYAEGRAREISGIQVSEGGRRLTVQVRRGTCVMARAFAVQPIPKHLFGGYWQSATFDRDTAIDGSPYDLAPPVASGAFRFKEHRAGVQVTLVRNDRYYLGAPLVDELVFKVYSDDLAVRAALLTGELTWATVPPGEIDEIRASAAASRLRARDPVPTIGYLALWLSQKAPAAPWLRDRRVRQALWYGLNIDEIIDKVRYGHAQRVFAHTPTVSWAFDDDAARNRYPFDPDRARLLIRSAGATMGPDGIYRWTDGRPMRIRIETSRGDTVREAILQIAQEQYRAIGVEIEPSLTSFQALVTRLDTDTRSEQADVQAVIIALGLGPDPNDAFLRWHSSQIAGGGNVVGFRDPVVDAALEAGRYGPDCSKAARRKAYATVDRILNEEAPFVFLFADHAVVFERTDLVAPPSKPWRAWAGVETWWFRQ